MCKIILTIFAITTFTFANGIKVTPSVHHFGTIKDSQTVVGTFQFTNHSQRTLEIKKVKTFCGCTFMEPPTRSLKPGETTRLTVNFNPKGKSDFIEWEVHVFTNLQQAPTALKFDATILRDHHLSDDVVSFGEFRRGKRVDKTIWFSPRQFPNFKISKVELQLDNKKMAKFLEFRYGMGNYDKLFPGKRKAFWAKITATENIPFGKITGSINFTTNVPGVEYVHIPVFAKVAGDISLSRDHVTMGMLKKGRPVTRNLMVYPTEENEHVVIESAQSSLPFIKTSVHAIIPNQYYEIKIISALSGKEPRGEFRGMITIHTSNSNQSKIEVPTQGYIR